MKYLLHDGGNAVPSPMFSTASRWLQSKPFEQQIVILALVLDPLGSLAGYLLGPAVGVDPIMGGVFGLVVARFPMSFFVMSRSR